MKQTTRLRQMMKSSTTAVAINAFDAFSARMVERVGFDGIYVGSFTTEASFLGKPDLMMMSKTDRLSIVRNIVKAVNIPVIADAEEGYGNALNVIDTVQDFEAAGVAAIHLDDEVIPSKCPFIPGLSRNQLISTDEMCGKIEAAVHARQDPDFGIIARTDVVGSVSLEQYYRDNLLEEVVRRSNAYAAAGADAIFIMALKEEELDYFAKKIKAPLLGIFANMEPHPIKAFQKAGYQIAINSSISLYAAAKGMKEALVKLKQTGDWNQITDLIISDDEFFDILDIEKYENYYQQFRVT